MELHADSTDDSHTVNDLFVSVENDFVLLGNLYTAISSKISLGFIHCAKPPAKCGVTTANKWSERTHVNQGRQRTLSSRAYGFTKQKEHLLTTAGNRTSAVLWTAGPTSHTFHFKSLTICPIQKNFNKKFDHLSYSKFYVKYHFFYCSLVY